MLRLQNITKTYPNAATPVLQNISASFSAGEFVAVLGESGCGKTTLLQILGGLDRDFTGKLFLNGQDTTLFSPTAWDACHGKKIGFVLQQYALLPTRTVLENVLLSLQLTGMPRARQKKAALHALQQVGMLSFRNMPVRKLSGGQQQRVAIARAIAPDPAILLCDEPTGALDSVHAGQIMQLLRTLTKNRLLIVVTHNASLARRYATRLLTLQDGKITRDTPLAAPVPQPVQRPVRLPEKRKLSLSTLFSIGLCSFRRKKLRTLLQTLTGAVSLLGIFFVLALSGGTKTYLARLEQQVLYHFPLRVQTTAQTDAFWSFAQVAAPPVSAGEIGVRAALSQALQHAGEAHPNDVAALARYLSAHTADFSAVCTQIEAHYGESWQVYTLEEEPVMLYPQAPLSAQSVFSGKEDSLEGLLAAQMQNFALLPEQKELLQSYTVLYGRLPQSWQEVVLIVEENGTLPDYALCQLGLYTPAQLQNGEVPASLPAQDLLGTEFGFLSTAQTYQQQNGVFCSIPAATLYKVLHAQEPLRIVGILQPQTGTALPGGCIGYTADLPKQALLYTAQSVAAQAQQTSPYISIFTGQPFTDLWERVTALDADAVESLLASLPPEWQQKYRPLWEKFSRMQLSEEQLSALLHTALASLSSQESYAQNLSLLGVGDPEDPVALLFYPRDFAAKEKLCALFAQYNADHPDAAITYTDSAAAILQSLHTGVHTVKTVLLAFGFLSLFVGACMTGVLSAAAVTERQQEIGLMRTLGAAGPDIRRLFELENILTGLLSGLLGVGLGRLLCPAGNTALRHLTGAAALLRPALPDMGILLLLGAVLSAAAGAVPARLAAKKDPARTLRFS